MLPNLHRQAQLFLAEHDSLPLLVEQRVMAGYFDDPSRPDEEDMAIAVISVRGMLTEDSPFWGTTYSQIRQQVDAAMENSSIAGVVLNMNTPGGSTDGAFETAEHIAAATKKKPIWAVASTNCCSAGYLLASATSRVYSSPVSGNIGSIGVYAAHADYSEMLKKAGVAVTLISAGKGKTDGNPYEPLSDAAKKNFQAEVDRLYGAFVGFVSKNRGIDPEEIKKFGAKLFHGQEAVAAGVADATGTINEALQAFGSRLQKKSAQATPGANIHSKGATAMSDIQSDAAVVDAAVEQTAAPVTVIGAGVQHSIEVAQLCALAGMPDQTTTMLDHLASGKSVGEIRGMLINLKAESKSQDEVRSAVLPSTGTKAAGVDPWNGPLVTAMQKFFGKEVA